MSQNAIRFAVLSAVLIAGVAGGIGLNAVLTGTTADDPCRGFGARADTIIGPAEEGSKEFSVCRKPGYEVIFDPDGTPVLQTLREEELLEYYKTHPAENPALIAEQTADAESSTKPFTRATIPAGPLIKDDICPEGSERGSIEKLNVSLCLPPDWTLTMEVDSGVQFSSPRATTTLAVFAPAYRPLSTGCADPTRVDVVGREYAVCQLHADPEGLVGYGIKTPDGIAIALEILPDATDEERTLLFALAYSAEVGGQE